MKKTAKTFLLAHTLMMFLLLFSAQAEAVKLFVLSPSIKERELAPGRDFYVIGLLDREGISAAKLPLDIRVDVAKTGPVGAGIFSPVRTIQSRVDKNTGITPERDIKFSYAGKAPWVNISREALMKSPPPDLVYHHEIPDSFYDPRIKAIVTENSFAVLIQGGATKKFDSDYNNIYDRDLECDLYRVFITLLSDDTVLKVYEMDLMLGTVKDKILARFSPAKHMEDVETFAKEHGYRVYKDSFPGYWNFGLDTTYEIPTRWRTNDALEYIEGRVHAFMYNVKETRCATQEVELGQIAFEGRLDSDDIIFYYYDIGEPELRYTSWSGTTKKIGQLVPFERGDRLVFTRADIGSETEKYYPDKNQGEVDWNVYNSVAIDRGKQISFHGAVTPIQPMRAEVIPHDDGTFTIGNRIDRLRYVFEDMVDGVLLTEEKAVFLTRNYKSTGTNDWSADSIYEFSHNFDLPEVMYGRIITVHVSALDKRGEKVDGSDEMFYLWVR